MSVLDDPNSRKEDRVYRELAASWKDIAQLVEKTAAHMAAQRELPQMLALLRLAAARDEEMLASMTKHAYA